MQEKYKRESGEGKIGIKERREERKKRKKDRRWSRWEVVW